MIRKSLNEHLTPADKSCEKKLWWWACWKCSQNLAVTVQKMWGQQLSCCVAMKIAQIKSIFLESYQTQKPETCGDRESTDLQALVDRYLLWEWWQSYVRHLCCRIWLVWRDVYSLTSKYVLLIVSSPGYVWASPCRLAFVQSLTVRSCWRKNVSLYSPEDTFFL